MQLFVRRYLVNTSRDGKIRMTAKALYERVLEDSKSNYNWIATASELLRVIELPKFPESYAQGIKIAILNCFSHLESMLDTPATTHDEKVAISFCYNSLSNSNEEALRAKRKYLHAIMMSITKELCLFSLYAHGTTFTKFRKEWVETKIEENIQKKELDFEHLIKALTTEFDTAVKTAKKNGLFDEDEKEELEVLAGIAKYIGENGKV